MSAGMKRDRITFLKHLQFDFLPSQLLLEGNSILKIAHGFRQHMLHAAEFPRLH